MSQWTRAIGGGNLWHRMTASEEGDGLSSGRLGFVCGETIPVAGGWEHAGNDEVGADDQHPRCRDWALRETYWADRFRALHGDVMKHLRSLVHEAEPRLEGVKLRARTDGRLGGRLTVFQLRASNVGIVLGGAGGLGAEAAGELLTTVEHLREIGGPSSWADLR